MEPEGSLQCSQVSATGTILIHTNPTHGLTHYSLNIHFNIILPSMRASLKWYFPPWFSSKTLYSSYAYWTVHHLDIWIKVGKLDDFLNNHQHMHIFSFDTIKL